jgi:hypothetical protein
VRYQLCSNFRLIAPHPLKLLPFLLALPHNLFPVDPQLHILPRDYILRRLITKWQHRPIMNFHAAALRRLSRHPITVQKPLDCPYYCLSRSEHVLRVRCYERAADERGGDKAGTDTVHCYGFVQLLKAGGNGPGQTNDLVQYKQHQLASSPLHTYHLFFKEENVTHTPCFAAPYRATGPAGYIPAILLVKTNFPAPEPFLRK